MKRKRQSDCDKWEKYFTIIYEDEHKKILQIFMDYFQDLKQQKKSIVTGESSVVPIHYRSFISRMQPKVADIEEMMVRQPNLVLNMIALAVDKVLTANESSPKLMVRLVGYDKPLMLLRDIKANLVGQMISIKGNVIRVSGIKPLYQQMAFSCNTCNNQMVFLLDDGLFATPTKCDTMNCKGKSFIPLRESSETKAIDWQKVKIQESQLEESKRDAGSVPRTIDVELIGEFVDNLMPGDLAFITGIVRYSQIKDKFSNGMHTLYLQAVNVSLATEVVDEDSKEVMLLEDLSKSRLSSKLCVDFDHVDFLAIQEISQEPNLFELLTHSLAPSIFGHEMVKAGLVLALFGGSRSNKMRSDSHILVVGDPGLGKSQMISYVSNLAPRGVFVCSNTSTSGGLTATLTKEAGTGEFAIEAGALVLADQGVCCIDEFDKMSEYEALLEAMEQQSVSIAKGGITCSLPARTSVIAAANPIGGHYNKAKTVSENLKMKSALLSRFDLIFILLDKPNENMDKFLSEHVMRLHGGKSTQSSRLASANHSSEPNTQGLVHRLVEARREIVDTLPMQLFKRYIAYAKKYCFPKLTPEAAFIIQEFYLTLRANYRSLDTAPITTRQLESLIRLATARAKCELRELVTKRDAEDVIEIMKQSLFETCEDENGFVQFQRSPMGTGMSNKNDVKRFVARLKQEFQQTSNDLFTYQQLYEIAQGIY